MDSPRDQRDTHNKIVADLSPSSGGMELALAGGAAVALGYWLDGVFGIRPVLTLILFFWVFVALSVGLYYRYRADMEAHEATAPWVETDQPAPAPKPVAPKTSEPAFYEPMIAEARRAKGTR